MRTVDRWRRIGLSLACFGWLMQLTPAGSARALGSDEPIRLDCGVNSLYILLRLKDAPCPLTAFYRLCRLAIRRATRWPSCRTRPARLG